MKVRYPDDVINKILCGDCLEILKQIPDESIDLVLTDPPYGISKKGLEIDYTNIQNRKLKKNSKKPKKIKYDFGEWDHFESRDELLNWTEQWVKECFRVLKESGNFVSFFDSNNISHFGDILNKYGYVRQIIVWHKTNPVPQIFKVGFMNSVELLSWATKQKGNKHTFNYQLGQHHNFIETPICMGKERTSHPTQKPIKAVQWLVEYLSNEGDIILDPFSGTGTFALVAKSLGRNYIGIEINPEYCQWAEERIKNADSLMNQRHLGLEEK